MHDRAQFWSPVPDWARGSLHARDIDISVLGGASLWLASGDTLQFRAQHGVGNIHGPRQTCKSDDYALRLAPDRVLLVSGLPTIATSGTARGCAITDISDGMLIFEIRGEAAAELMAQGCEYPFEDMTVLPHESASMQFAGLRVIVSRREHGWRLHVERPWATALWRWLEAHVGEARENWI